MCAPHKARTRRVLGLRRSTGRGTQPAVRQQSHSRAACAEPCSAARVALVSRGACPPRHDGFRGSLIKRRSGRRCPHGCGLPTGTTRARPYDKLTDQVSKFPVNTSFYASYNYNSSLDEDIYPALTESDKNLFLGQLLLSTRISDKLSIQLSPTYAKKGFTETIFEEENNIIIGLGSSFRITNKLAVNVEYFANLDRPEISPYQDVLSFGIDIETGGHVFQLLFSNTQTSDDVSVLTDAEGSWKDGDIYFGFNILRVF